MNDILLLEEPVDFNRKCLTTASDDEPLWITKQKSVVVKVMAQSVQKTIRLIDVEYAAKLE